MDEKWYKIYYRDFTDINPNSKQIEKFINKIFENSNYQFDIVITSGTKNLEELNNYVSSFNKISSNVYEKYTNNKIVRFVRNTSFNDLENIVKNSSFLITCEGGISHASIT